MSDQHQNHQLSPSRRDRMLAGELYIADDPAGLDDSTMPETATT